MVSLWDNGASVERRLSGILLKEQTEIHAVQQTHPRLDVFVIEKEHRSEAAFVLLFTLNHKHDSKSIV